jgi:class 3 adenylate cyclase
VHGIPETRYATTPDGVAIAFQAFGEGEHDLVLLTNWWSHVEAQWDDPFVDHALRRLASFCRVIRFDKRGVGLSDPVPIKDLPSLEEWSTDVLAVMDAVGSEQAVVWGSGSSGAVAMMFAATFPERTTGLILSDTYARLTRTSDYPFGMPADTWQEWVERMVVDWGKGFRMDAMAPSAAGDAQHRERWARYERLAASPGTARAMHEFMTTVDVRPVLSAIRVPTLILHRSGNTSRFGSAEYLAQHIAGADFVIIDGVDAVPFTAEADLLIDEVEEFITGVRGSPEPDRVLSTVLFTDVVGSTEQSAAMGDRRWRELLDAHDALLRRQLERFRGNVIKTTGDGILATFDGPARAIRCAQAMHDAVRALDLVLRVGLHTGEVELRDDDVSGIAVHIAQRVQAAAQPGEVLVSRTVVDLVAGSGLEFEDRGEHELKGVPGRWRLFGVRT